MKAKLATIIDSYPLRLALLLFAKAYSDVAEKEAGSDFIVFSVFQAKGRFEGKNCS